MHLPVFADSRHAIAAANDLSPSSPVQPGFVPLLIASIVGAQKAGKAFKQVRYPESSSKSTEEQVMDAAEAERAMGMNLSTGSEGVDEAQETSDQQDTSEDTLETEDENVEPVEDQSESATESSSGASQYTDEQLVAAGWTAEQIAQMRDNS